jgi:hypothetical protein
MRADRVEFSWDEREASWLIRIIVGEEVIQRHCALPENADERTLRSAVDKTARDEGYEVDETALVRRSPSTSSGPGWARKRFSGSSS